AGARRPGARADARAQHAHSPWRDRPRASDLRCQRRARADRRPPRQAGLTAPAMLPFPRSAFEEARARMGAYVYRTPLLTSRLLSERTGFDVRVKAELFQRGGSYKIRGPMNKFSYLMDEQKRRGVICSSAGNHAQGVALAAAIYGIKAVVVMAENATTSKIDATRAYGAEVVLHGTIWDEANERAKQLVEERGYTYIHPFDDEQLIVGQGTVGLEIYQ